VAENRLASQEGLCSMEYGVSIDHTLITFSYTSERLSYCDFKSSESNQTSLTVYCFWHFF